MYNRNKLNTITGPLTYRLKEVYVVLPTHPLYGQKVDLIKVGKTHTMQWGVIVNPMQKKFKYRVPLRWLNDELPDKIFIPLSRINKIIGIPFSALQQLTIFLNSISQNKNSCFKESNVKSYNKEQNEGTNFEKKSGYFDKKDLGDNPRKTKNYLIGTILFLMPTLLELMSEENVFKHKNSIITSEKIAIIYVRQSSMYQVQNHQESQKRQYNLKDRAIQLGWANEQILTIDEDLGVSGAHSENRPGYQKLTSMIALCQVGIILGIEVSRLARNCLDWYQLLELSGAFDTLIADEDAIFNPSDFNDRLLLGLKGTISEVELYQIKSRMMRGRINKARRGDLEMTLPIGYERDFSGKTRKSVNQEVRFAIERIFELFKNIRSVRAVLLELKKRNIEVPYWEKIKGLEKKISWRKPSYESIYAIIKNPIYAGFYIYGKRNSAYDPNTRKQVYKSVKKELIEVCIPDHHDGYINKEEYEENIKILENNKYLMPTSKGAPREGIALLQGIIFCSRCGQKMRPRYSINRNYYYCDREHRRFGEPVCGIASIFRVDALIEGIIFEVLNEGSVDLSFQLSQRFKEEQSASQKQIEQKLSRLEYEASLARRRYETVDPENRLVASTLESEWNEKLACLEKAKLELNKFNVAKNKFCKISVSDIKNTLSKLKNNWYSKSISIQDKKEIIRCIIDKVFINTEGKMLVVKIMWQGNSITELAIPKYIFSSSHIYYKITDLAKEKTDLEIAEILNQEKILTVKGRPWNKRRVMDFRLSNSIASGFTESTNPKYKTSSDYVTSTEISKMLDVSKATVLRWCKVGILENRKRKSTQDHLWIYFNSEIKNRLNGTIKDTTNIKVFNEIIKETGIQRKDIVKWVKERKHIIVRLLNGEKKNSILSIILINKKTNKMKHIIYKIRLK